MEGDGKTPNKISGIVLSMTGGYINLLSLRCSDIHVLEERCNLVNPQPSTA